MEHSVKEAFDADGFAAVRGLFSAADIAALANECDRLTGRTDLISQQNIRCRWADHHATGECRLDCFDPVVDLSELCKQVASDARIKDVLGTLLGEAVCLFKDKLIFKPSGAKGYDLHQD